MIEDGDEDAMKIGRQSVEDDVQMDAAELGSDYADASSQELPPLILKALQKGPPYPTISLYCLDVKSRRQSPQAEARRLMGYLTACEIPVEWWMLQVGQHTIAFRDEVSSSF